MQTLKQKKEAIQSAFSMGCPPKKKLTIFHVIWYDSKKDRGAFFISNHTKKLPAAGLLYDKRGKCRSWYFSAEKISSGWVGE